LALFSAKRFIASRLALPGEPVFLGQQAVGIVPTILHPNLVLDGAITSPFPALNVQTYHIQNHPIMEVKLPEVERLVGKPGLSPEGPPIEGEIVRPLGAMKGSLCQMGSSKFTAVRY
jgi:hypothetical protein